jgi:nicotinate-nucleotide adenylyltransferase
LRVGILGGAFNPPHIGHMVCAQEALLQLKLDTVHFVPMGQAPHREIQDDPGPEARLAMCEQATEGDPLLTVSGIEVARAGPSYTVDTLRELAGDSPGDELFLLLGGDQAAALPRWHEPEQVLELATVAVAERSEWPRARVTGEIASLAGAERVVFFEMPRVDVSSSLVRKRAAGGEPFRHFVPDAVARYIGANGLYGAAAAVGAE